MGLFRKPQPAKPIDADGITREFRGDGTPYLKVPGLQKVAAVRIGMMNLSLLETRSFPLNTDPTMVRTVDQVNLLTGLPAIAVIPKTRPVIDEASRLLRGGSRPMEGVELVTCVKPHSGIAEAFRALRTSILLSSGAAPTRTRIRSSVSAGTPAMVTAPPATTGSAPPLTSTASRRETPRARSSKFGVNRAGNCSK